MTIRVQDRTWNADRVGMLIKQCAEAVIPDSLHSQLYWTAAKDGDHGASSWHYANLSYNGSRGAALDLAGAMNDSGQRAMQAASRALIQHAELIVELIHSTPFADDNGFYVKNGRLVSAAVYQEPGPHLNHIHLAMTEAQCQALLPAVGHPSDPGNGTGGLPAFSTTWPLPAGHYFGLVSGPTESHGGFTADEKVWVREIQRRLIQKAYVPGVTNPGSGWADGLFEQPTAEAVTRFQRAEMPGTTFFGQVWADDFAKLFATSPPISGGGTTSGGLPAFSTTWPLPAGHYFGLVSGPTESHGGFTADEKVWVREIQRRLIQKAYVPGVTDPGSGWADGLFEQPTAEAVTRFQRAEMPGTTFFGQVWADDFAKLFATGTPAPPPVTNASHIFGWDASDHDYSRGMRVSHVRAAFDEGIRFLTYKISEWGSGEQTIHQHCGEMLTAARDVGMIWFGAYVVARTGRDIGQQSQAAIDGLNAQAPGLIDHPRFRWQMDTEKWSENGIVYDAVDPHIGSALLADLNQRTGKPVGLHYVPKWAYGDTIPGDDPLWASDYSGSGAPAPWQTEWSHSKQDDHPGWAPYSGRSPAVLQYSSDSVIGGQPTCDANVFRGTESDLLALIRA